MLPVFSRIILRFDNCCNLSLTSLAKFTNLSSFFLSGITAADIGARCFESFNTVLVFPSGRLSSLYASLSIARNALSTPAEGSITYGISHFFSSKL